MKIPCLKTERYIPQFKSHTTSQFHLYSTQFQILTQSQAWWHTSATPDSESLAAWGVQGQPQLCMSSYKTRSRLAWITWYPNSKTKRNKLLIFNLKYMKKKSRYETPNPILRKNKATGLTCTDSKLTTKLQLSRPCGTDQRTET